jgi:branched-chain amino acid transport system ATP-binding protein
MLEVKSLGVRYGRHQALDHVTVNVGRGEICVILGANGAGKSSLLKAIAGTVRVEPGSEIVMNGKPITGMKAHLIVEEGVALVPEGRGIFGELTVAENLELGSFPNRARAREKATLEQIYELFPRLAERKSQIARTMSGGEQQMVAVGRALMSDPKLIMFDEPSLGLAPKLVASIFDLVVKINQELGITVLLVEQNVQHSCQISDRAFVIENGEVALSGKGCDMLANEHVRRAYLGL